MALLSLRERLRDLAVLKTLVPRRVPRGRRGRRPAVAAWPWLVVVPFATALLVLAAVGGPATPATRTPAAVALRAE